MFLCFLIGNIYWVSILGLTTVFGHWGKDQGYKSKPQTREPCELPEKTEIEGVTPENVKLQFVVNSTKEHFVISWGTCHCLGNSGIWFSRSYSFTIFRCLVVTILTEYTSPSKLYVSQVGKEQCNVQCFIHYLESRHAECVMENLLTWMQTEIITVVENLQ